MYGKKKENKTDIEKTEEGAEMALTSNDLQAIQELLLPIHIRLDGIDNRLDGIDDRLNRMDERLDGMDDRLDGMDNRFDRIENRLDRVESEVSSLKSGQLEIRKELKEVDRKVSDTYDLALEAWGKSTENRRWLEGESRFPAKVQGG